MYCKIYLYIFAVVAILLTMSPREGEGSARRLDESFSMNLEEPKNYWQYSHLLEKMAQIEKNRNTRGEVDPKGKDKTPSDISEVEEGELIDDDWKSKNDHDSKGKLKRQEEILDYNLIPLRKVPELRQKGTLVLLFS